jgi:hypothetical protein
MERSEMRENAATPDCASLHPGYGCYPLSFIAEPEE